MIPYKTIEELINKHIALEADLSSGKIDKKLFRPAEVTTLLANPKKAKKILKWKQNIAFKNLVKEMVESDIKFVQKSGY